VAFRGFGAGAELGIAAIGFDLFVGGHGARISFRGAMVGSTFTVRWKEGNARGDEYHKWGRVRKSCGLI
jgi:hypothetical protein